MFDRDNNVWKINENYSIEQLSDVQVLKVSGNCSMFRKGSIFYSLYIVGHLS